jgi:hypothetical protein
MSPEQAVLNQLDVDTRTDVYSLGVLLYELLTGETPLDRQRLREAQILETLRIIREEEPPKPSTRVSGLGQRGTAVAAHRKVKPGALASEIRGDLDWIVMKALAKERSRRYDSASRFAEDLQRYLSDDLVEARPPSVWYQLKKFHQRNKALAASAIIVFLGLTLGLAGALWGLGQFRRANETSIAMLREKEAAAGNLAANLKELREKNDALQDALISQAITAAIAGDQRTTKEAIDNAELAGAKRSWRDTLNGLLAEYQGDHIEAISLLESAVNAEPENLAAQAILASACFNAGRIDEHEECVLRLDKLSPKTRFDTLFVVHANRFWNSTAAVQQISALVQDRTSWGVAHIMLAEAKAFNAWDRGDLSQAISAISDIEGAKSKLPAMAVIQQTEILACLAALDLAADDDSRRSEWLARAKAAAQTLERKFPSQGRYELAAYYYHIGDKDKSLEVLSDSSDFAQRSFREALLFGLGRFTEIQNSAEATLVTASASEAARIARRANHEDPSFLRRIWNNLALYASGEQDEARQEWKKLIAEREEFLWNQQYPLMLFSGQWNEQRLLQEAGKSHSRFREFFAHLCLANYYLYMIKDRGTAKRHFELAVKTGPSYSEAYVWAQSYLDLMKDESWPGWMKRDGPAGQPE